MCLYFSFHAVKMALLNAEEPRVNLFKKKLFWIKFFEIVTGTLMFPFCITYSDQAGLYQQNTTLSFNITVKYPFHYDPNTTAVYTNEDSPPKFSFDPALEICVQIFVFVAMVTLAAALLVLTLSCVVRKNTVVGTKVMVLDLFIAVTAAFIIVVSTSLWFYNLLRLQQDVYSEIETVRSNLKDSCTKENSNVVCVEYFPDYKPLFFSVCMGYLAFLLWLTNTGLVYRNVIQQPFDTTGSGALISQSETQETRSELRAFSEQETAA